MLKSFLNKGKLKMRLLTLVVLNSVFLSIVPSIVASKAKIITTNEDMCSMSDDLENNIRCEMKSDGKKSIGSLETLKMKFSSGCNITSVDSQNMKVLDTSYENNQLSLDVDVKDRFSSLTVSYNDSDSDDSPTQSLTYYIYKKDNITYTSSVSLDYAIEKSGNDPTIVNSSVSIGGITNPFIDITPTPVQKKTYSRTIKWKDDNGNIYPLVGAKVVLVYKSGNNVFNDKFEVYTDDNGSFTTNIIVGGVNVISYDLYLNGQYVSVKRPDDTIKNTKAGFENHSSDYKISLIDNIADFYNDKSVIISTKSKKKEESDFGKAVQIFQALYYYSKYAHNLKNGSSIPSCSAYYPCRYNFNKLNDNNSFDENAKTYYSCTEDKNNSKNNQYNIVFPIEQESYSIPIYESWDAIGHEYGHHVGNVTKCCKPIGSYNHYSANDEIDNLIEYISSSNKRIQTGLSLAFVESWPTYFSEIAQANFPTTIINKYADRFISDKKYEAYNFDSTNYYSLIPNKALSTYVGELNERSIMRFLYGLNIKVGNYSTNELASHDYLWSYMLDCGNEFYNIKKKTKIKFSDFYNYLLNKIYQTNVITLKNLSSLSTECLISPNIIETAQNSDGIYLHWTYGKEDNNATRNTKAYLSYYVNESLYDRIVLPYDCQKQSDGTIKCSAKLTSSLIKNISENNISVGLSFSPHYYSVKTNDLLDEEYTGPYTTIIWQGNGNCFSANSLIGLNIN